MRSAPLSRGGKRSRRGRDDTSSPSSSRSTLFLQEPRSPGSGQAARASLLPAPPALPAPRAPAAGSGPRSRIPARFTPAHTFPPRVRATLERCRGRSVPNFPAVPTAQPGVTDRQEGGFFSPFIYSLGGFFPLLETKAGCVPRRRVRGCRRCRDPGRCRASRAGGSGWPVSSAHRWLFRLSRALDLNLLLIHGSCSPSAAQLKAPRSRPQGHGDISTPGQRHCGTPSLDPLPPGDAEG
ncbi:uncharacterized protein LOC125337343 [Corvus hawaiiensis]|uniref:uncharacterized protein LOC125337343 n=1 Tax=Corvus hawaiiensis TaxID=134902 RepID=UPI00201A0C02|nr:uncharacterized protein LOC125337343 [Corvus hawaiiensis]